MSLPSVAPLLVLAALGWAVPIALTPAVLARVRRHGTVANYRGRAVSVGLGWTWLLWAGAFGLPALLARALPSAGRWTGYAPPAASAAVLVGAVAALGWLDDVWGDGSAKGFRGHFRALAEGRVTTGLVKVVGIGSVALWVTAPPGGLYDLRSLAAWGSAAACVALAANLVNLLDLRPGRALKGFLALEALALSIALSMLFGPLAALREAAAPTAFTVVWLALAAVGPVLACWRPDLGEVAMLGDSGANAMGALAGYLLALAAGALAGVDGLVALAVGLLAVNLASERVSFSAVIERTGWLRALDDLGRLPEEDVPAAGGEEPARAEGGGEPGADTAPAGSGVDTAPARGRGRPRPRPRKRP